jgi:hypothetical protein
MRSVRFLRWKADGKAVGFVPQAAQELHAGLVGFGLRGEGLARQKDLLALLGQADHIQLF